MVISDITGTAKKISWRGVFPTPALAAAQSLLAGPPRAMRAGGDR
jgi:hypothetical protein